MHLWDRVSSVFKNLPSADKTFIEYFWEGLKKSAAQLYFDVENAESTLSPYEIKTYNYIFWKKIVPVDGVWLLPQHTRRIPKLQTKIFDTDSEDYVEYNEDEDYTIIDNGTNIYIDWLVEAPTKVWAPEIWLRNNYLQLHARNYGYWNLFDWNPDPVKAKALLGLINETIQYASVENELKIGINGLVGLPFAYEAGTVVDIAVDGDDYSVTLSGAGENYVVRFPTTMCEQTEIIPISTAVTRYQPLIPDAVKVRYDGGERLIVKQLLEFPADGNMEASGTTNWMAIEGGAISKDASHQRSGNRCMKLVSLSKGDGFRSAVPTELTAGKYRLAYWCYSSEPGGVLFGYLRDVIGNVILCKQWSTAIAYEPIIIDFTLTQSYNEVLLYFISGSSGTFYIDDVTLYKTSDPVPYRCFKEDDKVIRVIGDFPYVSGDLLIINNLTLGSSEAAKVDSIDGDEITFTTNLIGEYDINDHMIVEYAAVSAPYVREIFIYTRAVSQYDPDNVDRYLLKIKQSGRKLTFVDNINT